MMKITALWWLVRSGLASLRERPVLAARLVAQVATQAASAVRDYLPHPATLSAPASASPARGASSPPAPPAPPSLTPPANTLHVHAPRPHVVRNANQVHAERHAEAGFNQRLAVFLTAYVGTMQTAYGFAALAVVGLLGVLTILNPTVYTFVAWLSQTFIQLVLLPVIMVGQNVLNRHAEVQAEEQFKAVLNTEHDAEQMIAHLSAQDDELLRQTQMLQQIVQHLIARAGPDEPSPAPAPAPARPVPAVSPPTPPARPRRRSGGNGSGSGTRGQEVSA